MSKRRLSSIIMVVSTAVLVAYDIWVGTNNVKGDTYSEIIRDWGSRLAALPWVVGLLAGHWFWNGKRYPARWAWPLALFSLAIMMVLQWNGWSDPILSVGVGMCAGRIAWALNKK